MITQVHQALPERAISQLCELVQVSRSWYYEKQTRPGEDEADVELRDAIERIILDFPGYGYRRVTHALKRTGWIVNHKRVLRITNLATDGLYIPAVKMTDVPLTEAWDT